MQFLIALLIALPAFAADQSVDLTTPRGEIAKLDIYNPGAAKALVLAPGQGCSARLDMYDAIGEEARKAGFTLVRLYWAYCVKDSVNGKPSDDLANEVEDYQTALEYARTQWRLSNHKIHLGGKSLGSLVSHIEFKSDNRYPSIALLTPVCRDVQGQPDPWKVYYPLLDQETRTVLMAQGNQDEICENRRFQDFISARPTNFVPLVVRGNHGFGVTDKNGALVPDLSLKNVQTIAKWIFTWL